MATANKTSIYATTKHINTILSGGGGRMSERNKETLPPAASTNRGGNEEAKKVKRKNKLLPQCKMFVFHKPNRCYKLETNKDRQWVRWKSSKEEST